MGFVKVNGKWVSKDDDNPIAGSSHGTGASGTNGYAYDSNTQALIPYEPLVERGEPF